MKTEDIRNSLASWANIITSKYTGLKVRFEYNEARRVYLVSLCPDRVTNIEEFSREVMAFEDELEHVYGSDTPLFCDNEELFQLSAEAETIVGFAELRPLEGWHLQIEHSFAVNPDYYNLAA